MATSLSFADRFGGCKARWGISRMNYLVPPGLYAVGEPDRDAPVVVTANYKMSYDIVRSALKGRNVWLLVLETFGINVWCAAGKGTFGTDEVVNRVARTELSSVVSHRRLILPILAGPGVSAHLVKARCGFDVAYAAMRAADLPEYLDNEEMTTQAMRELTFTFYERLVLVPVEMVLVLKSVLPVGALVYLAALVIAGGTHASTALVAYLGAVFVGIAVAPVILPFLPGRSFAVKGALAGAAYCALLLKGVGASWPLPVAAAVFLACCAVTSFYTLNFTGCTPYTSKSGVRKEMRLALPVMGGALFAALLLFAAGKAFS